VAPAHRLALLLLQHAQELHLRLQRQCRHLIQDQGAPMGQLNAADAALSGACKRPFHMAKELACREAGRDRAAVHLHQRPALPHTRPLRSRRPDRYAMPAAIKKGMGTQEL
jgi:hypothetical protein